MTYIVGGKLGNNPFLMIDCKVQHEESKWLFQDKVVSFNSGEDEIYYCQMGHAIIKQFIMMYDYIKTHEGEKINVFDKDEIKRMFDEINSAIEYSNFDFKSKGENILFFISKNDICKYTVKFNNETRKYYNISQVNIDENKCSTSNSPLTRHVGISQSELKEFCKSIIEEEKMGIPDDLKDRYTFIYTLDNEINYEFPYKSKYDVINQFMGMDFGNIEK